MELNDKVSQLEDEIKILKNEIQAVLLDLRDSYLSAKNPFNTSESSLSAPQPSAAVTQPATQEAPIPQDTPTAQAATAVREPAPAVQLAPEPIANSLTDSAIESNTEKTVSEIAARPAKKAPLLMKSWKQKPPAETTSAAAEQRNITPKEIDLKIISRLAAWVDNASNLIGPGRTLAIIDIAEVMGYISGELRNILKKFVIPAPADAASAKHNPKDYLSIWLELAQILGRDNKSEIALLYILCQESENR